MKMHDISLSGYENTRLVRYQDPIDAQPIPAIPFSKLGETDVPGVLKACYYRDGELVQQYSPQENHVGVIAATRLGKTTSFVIPTVLSFAKKQKKRSMIISDPKGELYRSTAATLEKEGYRVLLLNFRDFHHSEYWNPLTPIYRKYQEAMDISQKVDIVDVPNEGLRYVFEGKIYESQTELDHDVEQYGIMLVEEVMARFVLRWALFTTP